MDLDRLLAGPIGRIPPAVADRVVKGLKRIPPVRRRLDAELDGMLSELESEVKPYRDHYPVYRRLPTTGRDRQDVLSEMEQIAAIEAGRWTEGYVSGAVYHGDPEHVGFLDRVIQLNSQVNPLHSDLWPSATKYEAEIVAMTASMLGGDNEVCGTVTSGGTESILLAMKTYRDRARAERGVTKPEMVIPVTAHAAFDKAADFFGIRAVRIPVDGDFRAHVEAVSDAIGRNTVVVVGSAPAFPHGTIDPIAAMSAVALDRGVGFHTDACLGGFVLPWAERLGATVPRFDFRLPGVTSMSVDTHKYGYAAKGTSVVLYRDRELRRHQYFTATDWPGGLYFSPTLAGSRPGSLSAAAWAAMVSIGEDGYIEATRRILEAAGAIRAGVEAIEELEVLGDPLWVIAFGSEVLDVYQVMGRMAKRGWNLNGLHRPPAVHLAVTLRHTQPGVADRFVADLEETVAEVRADPSGAGGFAPVYGMAAAVPARTVVSEMLERYLDLLYEV